MQFVMTRQIECCLRVDTKYSLPEQLRRHHGGFVSNTLQFYLGQLIWRLHFDYLHTPKIAANLTLLHNYLILVLALYNTTILLYNPIFIASFFFFSLSKFPGSFLSAHTDFTIHTSNTIS
jgi:hypothetical protein